MNSASVGYEELSRSRRVLSTEAELHEKFPPSLHFFAPYLHQVKL